MATAEFSKLADVLSAALYGIQPSHKWNKRDSVLARWMNLEPVTQNEVSQREKNKHCKLMKIHGI